MIVTIGDLESRGSIYISRRADTAVVLSDDSVLDSSDNGLSGQRLTVEEGACFAFYFSVFLLVLVAFVFL